jgi:hypothetical protein
MVTAMPIRHIIPPSAATTEVTLAS